MGSASSKFKKYLQHGDEFAAMQVFQSSPELRKNLDPNLSYGDNHHHNTALHYAAKHGMKHLLRTFLNDLGGNPNKKNGCNETSLHCACHLMQQKSLSAQERRAACVVLLLQWRGVTLPGGEKEKVDLPAQDEKGNTALHYAAASGLKKCVELLVAHGTPLFVENHEKLTPCDMAMKSNHHDIALYLESKMVFADSSDTINEAELYGSSEQDEVYSGLRTQDLQEAKDQLLVETSDMLHIPLFTAEALLRDNEWSREALLEKWMKDPVLCCQLAGVQPPASALQHSNTSPPVSSDEVTLEYQGGSYGSPSIKNNKQEAETICEICTNPIPCWDEPVHISCEHRFCTACWESYLTVKIQEGDAHHILCPAFQCHILVPVEVIEKLVSPEMARRYLQFDIKAFVESNRSIKWCPMPGCGRAVRLPETEQTQPESLNIPSAKAPLLTSHAVDCGNGHFFCWECLGEAHAPCGCDQWLEWQQKISEVKPEELRSSCIETEDAANCLWLVTNSKPCPNCKSPIQKNEGCNHMKCSKCKFDFCWVCLESWKKHSSATGGYFRCNRFEAVHKADEKQGLLISEATLRNQQMQELNRFLHYYTRFKNHENSQKLEEPLLNAVRHKMEVLASSLVQGQQREESAEKGTKFVEEGVRELLKARRVLCGSYVYGYYLEDNGYNKTIFEFMQNELEEVTEKLSEMIARPYLRTPRSVIIQTSGLARRKRHEFVRAVSKGLIPPETPPALRKVRKKRFPGLMGMDPVDDDQMTQAIAASLKDLDPNNPWVKDGQGRHTNLSAIYDWPDFDSDEEESEVNQALAVSLLGECERPGCSRPRARNPRTGTIHEYCSLRCSKAAQLGTDEDVYRVSVTADYNMDLVIALEMSRLQMIEDEMKKKQQTATDGSTNETGTVAGSSIGPNETCLTTTQEILDDQQLKLAIQLSLQESSKLPAPVLEVVHKSLSADRTGCLSDEMEVRRSASDFSMDECSGNRLDESSVLVYQKTSADITVDYFLKSLASKEIDLKNFNIEKDWSSKTDKDPICFKMCASEVEDGRFEIGDIHENGRFDTIDIEEESRLRRSHSTGDLYLRSHDSDIQYFDSDHSHDEKPEDVARMSLTLKRSLRQASSAEADEDCTSEVGIYGQSSVEDTSDSLNADLEVCGILGTTDEDSSEPKVQICQMKVRSDDNISSTSKSSFLGTHRKVFRVAKSSALRIRICKSPKLETDSSNEYESETGIPKSPTLYISGVSISRTPEPRSPAVVAVVTGRQSRSSSLTVPVALSPEPRSPKSPSLEPGSPSMSADRLRSSSLAVPTTTVTTAMTVVSPPQSPNAQAGSPRMCSEAVNVPGVSKSASEPEREKEMFRFPKSSTDGALSSVLHVQESNLSSDDFHEALFLERSPKSSKKRKKSKKDRNKENWDNKDRKNKEASSVL